MSYIPAPVFANNVSQMWGKSISFNVQTAGEIGNTITGYLPISINRFRNTAANGSATASQIIAESATGSLSPVSFAGRDVQGAAMFNSAAGPTGQGIVTSLIPQATSQVLFAYYNGIVAKQDANASSSGIVSYHVYLAPCYYTS